MLIDIALNITDRQFKGEVSEVMSRSKDKKVMPILIGLDSHSSKLCIEIAKEYKTVSTVGIHPTSSKCCNIEDIVPYINEDVVVAVGECGLDYDRLVFADKESQKKTFRAQLDLGGECYFLHSRSCHRDFIEMVSDYRINGVVHSFTGSLEEAKELIKRGFYIGLNGCSVKTPEGMELLNELPLESLLIETDSPYCKIRKSYAAFKYVKTNFSDPKILKKRNEPCCVTQMVEVISGATGQDYDFIAEMMLENTIRLYGDKLRKMIPNWK